MVDEAFSTSKEATALGWKSPTLAASIHTLQFCDDATLLAKGRGEMQQLFELYLSWCDKFRLNVNVGKCSVTRLAAPKSVVAQATLSLALDRWRFPIRVRRKKQVRDNARTRKKAPRLKKGCIAPFAIVRGKEVKEVLQFRPLIFRPGWPRRTWRKWQSGLCGQQDGFERTWDLQTHSLMWHLELPRVPCLPQNCTT